MTCCARDGATRRAFLTAVTGAVVAACAGPGSDVAASRQADVMRQGAAALAAGPVVDLHAHPGQFTRITAGELSPAAVTEMRGAGVTAAFFAAVGDGPVIRREPGGIRNYREPQAGELRRSTVGQLERVRVRAGEGVVGLVLEPGDLARISAEGRVAALLAVEGGDPLEGDARYVRELYGIGVRSIQIVHYRVNELGDIQTEPSRHGGLTQNGRDAVVEMNRLGMVVDGAHASPDTLRAILAVSRTPIVVSHTGPAERRAFARHLPDDLLRAVAARGGVIGVWPIARSRPATLDEFIADLRHVQKVAGIDHTAFATDMTGMSTYTAILTYPEFAAVPAALLTAGFSEEDCRKLLGGNAARVVDASLAAR
jgi:membrane dipeptidase